MNIKPEFPTDFIWGVATSAFQIEGGVEGRGESIWDDFCRQPGVIADGSNGDMACGHYYRCDEDVELIRELGVPDYRFSISWPRVQPSGSGDWSQKGLDFYDRLLDSLLAKGISPHMTLYHWDLPQALQENRGWGDRDITNRFVEYAVKVTERYADRVASIATINEPWVVAILGHEEGIFAPGIKDRRVAMQVSHHLLLAHGMAVEAMRDLGVRTPLGIVLNQGPILPANADEEADCARARLEDGLLVRWYMDALMDASYPRDVIDFLGENVPEIQQGDMSLISTPLDFLGINYYTRGFFSHSVAQPEYVGENKTSMGWEIYPEGLTETLVRLRDDYTDLPPIYVTENGAAFADEIEVNESNEPRVHDLHRIDYLRNHIAALRKALDAGVDVRAYFVWSLLDNFEWSSGYEKRFGIVYVDYENLMRIPKDSAYWYRDFIKIQLDDLNRSTKES